MTDALKAIGNLNKRYADIAYLDKMQKKEETRTPEEIVDNIRRKLNGSI